MKAALYDASPPNKQSWMNRKARLKMSCPLRKCRSYRAWDPQMALRTLVSLVKAPQSEPPHYHRMVKNAIYEAIASPVTNCVSFEKICSAATMNRS